MFTVPDAIETIECETHAEAVKESRKYDDKYCRITIIGNFIYCTEPKTEDWKPYYLGQQK